MRLVLCDVASPSFFWKNCCFALGVLACCTKAMKPSTEKSFFIKSGLVVFFLKFLQGFNSAARIEMMFGIGLAMTQPSFTLTNSWTHRLTCCAESPSVAIDHPKLWFWRQFSQHIPFSLLVSDKAEAHSKHKLWRQAWAFQNLSPSHIAISMCSSQRVCESYFSPMTHLLQPDDSFSSTSRFVNPKRFPRRLVLTYWNPDSRFPKRFVFA